MNASSKHGKGEQLTKPDASTLMVGSMRPKINILAMSSLRLNFLRPRRIYGMLKSTESDMNHTLWFAASALAAWILVGAVAMS
jgi:hypothetical protein